jgi:hypothetical protein
MTVVSGADSNDNPKAWFSLKNAESLGFDNILREYFYSKVSTYFQCQLCIAQFSNLLITLCIWDTSSKNNSPYSKWPSLNEREIFNKTLSSVLYKNTAACRL